MLDHENRDFQHPSKETVSSGGQEHETYPERMELHKEDTAVDEADLRDSALAEVKRLEQELEEARRAATEWQRQAEQVKEQLLRTLADFDNYRKRVRKEKEDAVKYAALPLIESLLPVIDNFERALDLAQHHETVQSTDLEAFVNGIDMVYRQFLQALAQAGLSMIETEGKPFNPYEHNAVMQVESEEHEPGMVVEELQTGYRYLDRVIRPAMVKVSV
jgi:molecular chaperone GrpE